MKEEKCGGCGNDQQHVNDILNSLPATVHRTSPKGLKDLSILMPADDGVARRWGRPSFLDDGSIQYPDSVDPPPDINGYIRSETNHCLFHPVWPECKLRMQGLKMDRNTGAVQVVMVCNNPESEHSMKFVGAKACDECPVRKAFKS